MEPGKSSTTRPSIRKAGAGGAGAPKSEVVAKPSQAPKNKGVVGEVVIIPLDSVQNNTWNPNVMTAFQYEGLKHDLKTIGWLKSDSMLVWGKDERGKKQNLIINGEHRWRGAKEIGMTEGPAVILNGLSRAQAIALTIRLDNKRGKFDPDKLAVAVREVKIEFPDINIGLELGFTDEAAMKMLAVPPLVLNGEGATQPVSSNAVVHSENAHVKMVPLYFSLEQYARFEEKMRELAKRYETANVTDTIIAAIDEVSEKK